MTPRLATVLSVTEETCTAVAGGVVVEAPFAGAFPGPRAERVSPGHLVALATGADGAEQVVWRWFDAVVVGRDGDRVTLWEPSHGLVVATPRDRDRRYPLGARAYASAGLPGADWWVAGPAVAAEDATVDLAEVVAFLTEVGVLDGPA